MKMPGRILRLARPLYILLAALTYVLGASIPAYLGKSFNHATFWLGLACVLLAQVSMSLLAEVFRPHNEPLIENETPGQKETLRNNALYISIASLMTYAVLAYLLLTNYQLPISTFYFLLLSSSLILAYSIPPFRLLDRGFGELALAAHIAYVIPSIGFLLRAAENHLLLAVVIVPLTVLALAYFLVLNFPSFASDQKYQRNTLLRRLTWERAIPLHHSLVILTYVLFLGAPLFGFSFLLLWPAFLTLPFAIFQVIQLRGLARGNPPNWPLLTSTALSVFGLTIYFLTLTFWLR